MLGEYVKESVRLFFRSELASKEATAIVQSNKFACLLRRLGVEDHYADVGWARIADLQDSEELSSDLFRCSAGSGVGIPNWDVICKYHSGWDSSIADDYILEGIEAFGKEWSDLPTVGGSC